MVMQIGGLQVSGSQLPVASHADRLRGKWLRKLVLFKFRGLNFLLHSMKIVPRNMAMRGKYQS